jgi:hypothetical protein
LNKFQKFKYTAKTRIWFIFSLVFLTVAIIGGLMMAMPDKHSPEIYKASVLQILWKAPVIEVPVEDITPIIETPQEIVEPIIEKVKIKPEASVQEKSKQRLRQHLLNKYSN